MAAEVLGGYLSGSLALLADAGHMLTDFAGLALAWYGFRLARRPADRQRTYGWDRFSILAAFVNGLTLFVVAGMIVVEAAHRLSEPSPVAGGLMLAVAAAGLGVNILAFVLLMGGDRGNLNLRAALLHVMGDLLGSVAAIAAAVIILFTGWMPIDPILSVLVAVIILRSAYRVVVDSGRILIEAAPKGLDTKEIASHLEASLAGVSNVHHVHAWSISEERTMVTLHARIEGAGRPPEAVVGEIKLVLRQRFGIDHANVEVEVAECADGVRSPT